MPAQRVVVETTDGPVRSRLGHECVSARELVRAVFIGT
jgi:hypothetical protein